MHLDQLENFAARLEYSLPKECKLFLKPYLNGIEPELAILHKSGGLNLIFIEYLQISEAVRALSKVSGGLSINAESRSSNITHNLPIWRIKLAHSELNKLYGFRMRKRVFNDRHPPQITITLFYPNFAFDEDEKAYVKSLLLKLDAGLLDNSNYSETQIDPSKFCPQVSYESFPALDPRTVPDLSNWLKLSEANTHSPLNFQSDQKRIILNEENIKRRRIKGGPGSGKTEALIARAGELSDNKKEVLYLTYNITILNELRIRFSKHTKNNNGRVVWLNYHNWCRRVSYQFHFEDEWAAQFIGTDEDQKPFDGVGSFIIKQLQTRNILDEFKFDAIIIDEAQDMEVTWLEAALLFLRPEGELLIAADTRQDIYDKSQNWTNEKINGLGFSGPWLTLNSSFRTPNYLVPLINNYKAKFLDHISFEDSEELVSDNLENRQLSLDDRLELLEVSQSNLVTSSFDQVHKIIEQDKKAYSGNADRSVEDIVVLVPKKEIGASIAKALVQRNVKLETTFKYQGQRGNFEERDLKLEFSSTSGRVKISTIHSFKGMSGTRIVLVLNQNDNPSFRKLVYVGLSRLKAGSLGQSLFIVSSNTSLNQFFKNALRS